MRLTQALCALALSLPLPALADTAPVVQQVRATKVMYDAGVASRDALLVLAAAKLRRTLGLEQAEGASDDGTHLSWQKMTNTARDLAFGDPLMLGLIEDMEAEGVKGVLNGPVYNIGKIAAKADDVYRDVPFQARAYAEVYVEGKGPEDLNLTILDEKDRIVCTDTDASAIAYCGWTPRADGTFSIKVTNASGRASTYSLITN